MSRWRWDGNHGARDRALAVSVSVDSRYGYAQVNQGGDMYLIFFCGRETRRSRENRLKCLDRRRVSRG